MTRMMNRALLPLMRRHVTRLQADASALSRVRGIGLRCLRLANLQCHACENSRSSINSGKIIFEINPIERCAIPINPSFINGARNMADFTTEILCGSSLLLMGPVEWRVIELFFL